MESFEAAAEAIVTGDANSLRTLLAGNRDLVRERSARNHRATLLHYLGANGVEQERQTSPHNAPDLARILLDAGSDVDAVADIYGHSTTLELVASSVHPRRAGVQTSLMEVLLAYGGDINGGIGGRPVIAALRNGHGQAAEFLARQGAALDLEGAAGVGRLDIVQQFVRVDGSLIEGATEAQRELGFVWACEYGRTEMVAFLLDKGLDPRADGGTGLTGLHWAVTGGRLDAMDLLIRRGAALEAVNRYGGTPLGQAVWSAINSDASCDYLPVVKTLLQSGAKVDSNLLAYLSQHSDHPQMERIAQALRAY